MRPPHARRSLPATGPQTGSSVVILVGGLTPEAAVERLLQLVDVPEAEPILILPSMANRPASGTHPKVAAGLLSAIRSRAGAGIPTGTTMPVKRRWEHLARTFEVQPVMLGRRGWDRVEFRSDSYRLDVAYLPSEFTDAAALIAIPALRDDSLVLGFWREMAHPHTRLRTHNMDRDRMIVELSTTVRAHYLLDASRLPEGVSLNLLAWTDNPVTAELVGLGIRHHLEEVQGYESIGPWENARVQAAAELGHGPMSGSAILLQADGSDEDMRMIAVYLADQLGCRIEWVTGRNADGR